MESPEQTRQLVPVFMEQSEGQDIRDLLYVRDEEGELRSLAELLSASESDDGTEVPGMLTTSIIETTSAERGTTISTVSVSPFRLCCIVIGGIKICFQCQI
jgi:hypothetical protein